jgi:magnesium-transporting ATPase (P-type)
MEKKILSAEDAKKASPEELFNILDTDKTGLSSTEAKKRLTVFGVNEISEKKS